MAKLTKFAYITKIIIFTPMKYLVRVLKYFVYITVVMALILLALSLLGIVLLTYKRRREE